MSPDTLPPVKLKGPATTILKPPHLAQAAMPIGGIGAGCIAFNGYGGLQDFSIRHEPALHAVPDSFTRRPDSAFGLLHIKGDHPVTRLLEGPLPVEKIYAFGTKSHGGRISGAEGLPRFSKCAFRGSFPFAQALLKDKALPVSAVVTAWNPFIPNDARDSGFPAAILEYTFENRSSAPVDIEFSFHATHLAQPRIDDSDTSRNAVIPAQGVYFYNEEPTESLDHGSAALVALGDLPQVKAMWFRGGWFDAPTALWREVSEGRFEPNDGSAAPDCHGLNGGSILLAATLEPGEKQTFPVALCWHFPNVGNMINDHAYYTDRAAPCQPDDSGCGCSDDSDTTNGMPAWHPWYAGEWADARAVARELSDRWLELRDRTLAFHHALHRSTLPEPALEAVAANLAIIKSPTILRQENGNLWGWEGCFAGKGCCPGTCTHVWNYAQAIPHLFPDLERTLREQELERSMNEQGHINFRAALPDGPTTHDYHPAADGQLGGIVKLYRDWQISGDTAWMKRLYPMARKSLRYCLDRWDPDRLGALIEPHHNTYDIEFYGPDPMCQTILLAALQAMKAMSACPEIDDPEMAGECADLAAKAASWLDEQLFEGGYYRQRVMWNSDPIKDRSLQEALDAGHIRNPEERQLLEAEGPKYQYGDGCLSDALLGIWMARLNHLPVPLDTAKVRATLQAIHRHNFKSNLSTHANTQRPGFAVGDEGGLVTCTWPVGNRPALPFPYADEVFTGIEYQNAAHMIMDGLIEEGLALVAAVRKRYDGRVRNPWNEYECGNYYARAMASYALLQAFSGFRYSAVEKTLWFTPQLETRPFRMFFSAASGWGKVTLKKRKLSIEIIDGELAVARIHLKDVNITRQLDPGITIGSGEKWSVALE